MGWVTSRTDALLWIRIADRFYISARFLIWETFTYFPIGLTAFYLGAHAIELYLKALLIHHTGKFLSGHDIELLFSECKKYDDFFKDDEISKYFKSKSDPKKPTQSWADYTGFLKYPEDLPQKKESAFGVIFTWEGSFESSTFGSLDKIVAHIHETIVLPNIKEPRGDTFADLIQLINDDSPIAGFLSNPTRAMVYIFKQNPFLADLYNVKIKEDEQVE